MSRNSELAKNLAFFPNYSLRLCGLRTILLGQIERNRRGRSYGYARTNLVQSDLTRIRPQFRTLVQFRR